MINYTTGNILETNTRAIVNTVNCEGFMGKGIAYQFKLKFPENNKEYIKLCRNHQFNIGDIFMHEESDKIILNFPTKNEWRRKSEYDFIEKGLKTLKEKLLNYNIPSVAIPPLGCGNGGLEWTEVKRLIELYLSDISYKTEITVYEPIYNKNIRFKSEVQKAPKLSSSHILLMKFKKNLKRFNKIRLQKAAYLNNIISGQDYFKFQGHQFGPYAHSIDILSRDIKEFQDFYNIDTEEAYEKAYEILISKNVNNKLDNFKSSLEKTILIVNEIQDDSNLELLTTILYIIQNNIEIDEDEIVEVVKSWNEHKHSSFSSEKIKKGITHLENIELIRKNLYNKFELSS